jgi:hypothetical protein
MAAVTKTSEEEGLADDPIFFERPGLVALVTARALVYRAVPLSYFPGEF